MPTANPSLEPPAEQSLCPSPTQRAAAEPERNASGRTKPSEPRAARNESLVPNKASMATRRQTRVGLLAWSEHGGILASRWAVSHSRAFAYTDYHFPCSRLFFDPCSVKFPTNIGEPRPECPARRFFHLSSSGLRSHPCASPKRGSTKRFGRAIRDEQIGGDTLIAEMCGSSSIVSTRRGSRSPIPTL